MAEIERSTAQGAEAWMPAFDIPDNAEMESEALTRFSLQSRGGEIEVDIWAFRGGALANVRCRGTWAALSSAGLVSSTWLVEDRRSWCVAFTDGAPRVVVGGRGRPKGRYISVRRGDACDYHLSWPVTREQSDRYRARLDQLWRQSGRASAASERTNPECADGATSSGPWPENIADMHAQDSLSSALAWWKERIGETGCRYTDDSQRRIDQALEELRRAVSDGNLVQRPRVSRLDGRRIGNVVCWPGRGNVAPVDPAALH